MSRIGKMPIALPAGVEVKFENGVVTVKGPKGALTREIVGNIGVEVEGSTLLVKALDDAADTNAKHGLYRALLNGMVTGVTAGFVRRSFQSQQSIFCSSSESIGSIRFFV